jgi:hypothetical protein
MSYVSKAKDFLYKFVKENPTLEQEANDMYQLFLDNLSEEGTSPFSEYVQFVSACEDLR